MSFLRHREIYQVETGGRGRNRGYARTSRLDESPVGYSLAGCSPAEPASASPTGGTLQQWRGALQLAIRCYLKTTLTRGLTLGAHPTPIVTNRCSPTAEVSSIVNAIGSFRTPSPSLRETPCFRTFAASFFGSKVMLISQYMHLVHISQMRSKI